MLNCGMIGVEATLEMENNSLEKLDNIEELPGTKLLVKNVVFFKIPLFLEIISSSF
jgi:hypothetical protein